MDADQVLGKSTLPRRRGWVFLALLALLALALTTFVVGRGSDRPLRLASTCPDAESISPLEDGQQQTVDDAENLACVQPEITTTSTSVDPTSTTLDTAVDASLPMATLRGAKDGLEVTVDVRPPEPKTADILTLGITARDSDGGDMSISVRWEPDRGGTVKGTNDCYENTPRPTKASVTTDERTFSYRKPGVVPIAVIVNTTYCADWDIEPKTLRVEGKVTVGPGLVLTNGPLPLGLDADVLDEESTPTTTAIGVWANDRDGFIHMIEVDWGDGSAPEVLSTPLEQCVDPLHTWPGPARFDRIVRHKYPAGEFVARVTVKSSGCKGLDEEVKTVEVPVNADR